MRLIKRKTNINFLGKTRRKIALGISVLIVVVSLVELAVEGLEFGIDFTGGILLELGYPEAANLEEIRVNLADAGYEDALVQRFGSDTDVLVRLPPQEGTNPDELREDLRRTVAVGTDGVDLRRVEFVSPQVGKELTERGGLAMIIALLLIFVYVMIRFQWKFAAGAVAALIHDVVVTVGNRPPESLADRASFDVSNRTSLSMVRFDAWVLPFLQRWASKSQQEFLFTKMFRRA